MGLTNVTTQLVDLAREHYEIGMSSDGTAIAIPRIRPRVARRLEGSYRALRSALAVEYWNRHGCVPNGSALTQAIRIIEAQAESAEPRDVHDRVALLDDNRIILDLGDDSGAAVEITASGWRIVDEPPVLFRRSQRTGALPRPARGGGAEDLWSRLNIRVEDRPLVWSWLTAALFPDSDHPILAFHGDAGTGKSTACRLIRSLIEPAPNTNHLPPHDLEDWQHSVNEGWLSAFGNLSRIPEWWSNALCEAQGCVILEGIGLGYITPALAARLLAVELPPISDTARIEENDLECEWKRTQPLVLGALLDTVVHVLRELPSNERRFEYILATLDETTTARFSAMATEDHPPPAVRAIQGCLHRSWHGTSVELLELLAAARSGESRISPRALTGQLRRFASGMQSLGWDIWEDKNREKITVWHLTPPGVDPEPIDASPARGFDNSATGWLYLIMGPWWAKLGITNHPRTRLATHSWFAPDLRDLWVGPGQSVREVETRILQLFNHPASGVDMLGMHGEQFDGAWESWSRSDLTPSPKSLPELIRVLEERLLEAGVAITRLDLEAVGLTLDIPAAALHPTSGEPCVTPAAPRLPEGSPKGLRERGEQGADG